MSQESRLIAFEQALKDEGIKGTNLEPVARSIFQQESSSGANVKTSNAGARGPMQVLPATFKAYNPQGNIDNPYDNSVGGLRYIKDLFSKTNDVGLTAVGYYGGPKAIEKAKQGIAVSDPRNPNAPNTLQYMEQVMGRTKGTPAGKQQRPVVPKTIREAAPELGPNYQAALALMAKADDLSEAREKIAEEEELASAGADFSQAKQMLAQIKPVTGFTAQEPRRMASGGLASAYAVRNPRLSSADRTKQDEMNKSIKDYETKVDEYNKAVAAHNEMLKNFVPGSRFKPGPSTPPEFTLKAPTAPLTQAEVDKFVADAKRRAIENAQASTSAMRAVQAPNQFNLGSFGLGDVSGFAGTSTKLFADGGEAKKPEPTMGEKVKGTAKEVLRSMQYTPYDLLGAPVDIGNLALKGVDYVTGSKLATDKPVGGSEYLIQKSRELGIADQPTGSTTETLTRLGTGIVSPTAGPKALALAAEKVAAKAAPKTASRAQLDAVKAAEPVPTKAPEPTATPAPAFTTPAPDRAPGKMYPDEIDPAVQKQIEEIVVPSPAEKDRLFFGQVEKWTQSLSGKPTVQELKNRFSKVGRDYEINRLNLALEGKKPTDKVDAKELLETLKATSPQRYRTVINEPEQGRFFQGMDNPNPSSPLGTINLMEDIDPKTSLSGGVAQDLQRLKSIITEPYYFSARKPEDIKALATYLRGPLINQSDLANSVVKFEKDITELDDIVSNLYKDKDAYRYIYTGSARVGLDGAQEIKKAQEKLLPKILQQNNLDPAKYEYNFQLPEAVRETLDKQIQEFVSNKIGKELAKKYKFQFRDIPSLETTMQTLYDQARLQKKIAMTDASTVYEDALNTAIKKLEAEAPYSGHHMSITGSANPVSFSRFMDVELPMFQVGNTKDLKGIFVTELQSDRLDDIRKYGPKGGSKNKDMMEYDRLLDEQARLVDEKDKLLENRYFKQLSEKEKNRFFELETEDQKLEQRMNVLLNRSKRNESASYGISEPFPGMEKMPQVTQQLMIKNAVAAAIKRNNEFVLFPGADSAQPQLYEKLPFNVKTVVKDLGPGFEIKKVPMQSEDGSVVERLGIFWDEKAAKRVAKEGVRFAKGGSVDKNDLPNQKYI